MRVELKNTYVLVTITEANGQERVFWLAPDQQILEDNVNFVDLINDVNLKYEFNWNGFLNKPDYISINNTKHWANPFIHVLSSKFGTFKIKRMIAENRLKVDCYFHRDLDLEKTTVPCVAFKVQTKDATYLINKDYTLTNLVDIESKINEFDLNTDYPFVWDDPELNYFSGEPYGSTPLLQTNDITRIEFQCDVFKQAQLANPKILEAPIRAASSLNENVNGIIRTFNKSFNEVCIQNLKTFKEFSSAFKKDWGTCVDKYGNKFQCTPSYNHREFKLNDKTTDFEEFLVKVYDYLSQNNYVLNNQYLIHGQSIDTTLTTYCQYLLKNPDFFAAKFLKQQIEDITAEFKKYNFTIDINSLIRKYYKNKNIYKLYYRMFIDYYVENYIKVDINNGIDVCKKYGITGKNLSAIILDVVN